MFDSIDYRSLKDRLNLAMKHEKARLDEARRKRNVAAFVDFASNLISLAGYSKGARFSLATDMQPVYDKAYAQAKERYRNALLDYKGKIAGISLYNVNGAGSATPHTARPVSFMPTVGTVSLSTGLLEKSQKSFANDRKNSSKYNRQLKNYSYVHRKQ